MVRLPLFAATFVGFKFVAENPLHIVRSSGDEWEQEPGNKNLRVESY